MSSRILITLFIFLSQITAEPPSVGCQQAQNRLGDGWECTTSKVLGSGSSGITYKMHNTGTQQKAIVKITYSVDPGDSDKKAIDEINMINRFSHPNVIKLIKNHVGTLYAYQLLEDGSNGNLEDYVENHLDKFKDTRFAMTMFKGIVEGVKHMHGKGFVHADLKGGNIVLDDSLTPKIIDFDLAVIKDRKDSLRGTPLYMDPRLIVDRNNFYDQYIDVYSLGVILYHMTQGGSFPFSARTQEALKVAINKGSYTIKKGTDVSVAMLIARCLRRKATDRPTIDQLLQTVDGIIQTDFDLLLKKDHSIKNNVESQPKDFEIGGPITRDIAKPNGFMLGDQFDDEPEPITFTRAGIAQNGVNKKKQQRRVLSQAADHLVSSGMEPTRPAGSSQFDTTGYFLIGVLIGIFVVVLNQLVKRLKSLQQRSKEVREADAQPEKVDSAASHQQSSGQLQVYLE